MPMRRAEIPNGVRFITFSCERRLPLLGDPATRDEFVDALFEARERHGFQLFAWVVMPEHVHILMRPNGHSIAMTLRSLKQSAAQCVLARWRRVDAPMLAQITDSAGSSRFWLKGGGFDRNVRDDDEFSRHVRYIHRNPVDRGLVAGPSEWKWSSVHWWAKSSTSRPCDPPPGPDRSWEKWRGYQ